MQNSVDDEVRKILTKNSQLIVDLVKHGQLEKGINSFGDIVGRYALSTQGYANADNISTPKKFGEPYNFYWTGQTIENMGFKLNKQSYSIFTVAGKQRLLTQLYGKLFDLTEEHNTWVNEQIIEPNLVKWVEENWWKLTA